MFCCQKCGASVPSGTPISRVVCSSRSRRYPSRAGANPAYELKRLYLRRKGRKNGRRLDMVYVKRRQRDRSKRPPEPGQVKRTPDYGGCGREIVRELVVCPACREQASSTHR